MQQCSPNGEAGTRAVYVMRQSIAIETKVTSGRTNVHVTKCVVAAQVEQANLNRGKTTKITAALCEV